MGNDKTTALNWGGGFCYKLVPNLHAHTRGHSKSGGNGGKHGDDDVENLSPD